MRPRHTEADRRTFAAALGDSLRDPNVSKLLTEAFRLRSASAVRRTKQFLSEQMALWGPV